MYKYIVWDEEKSNRLYDYVAMNPPKETAYFGYQVGKAIVNFCKYFVNDISDCVCLDYGCGSGHIIGYFLEENIKIYGVDMSEKSIEVVNQKYEGCSYWGGGRVFKGDKLPFTDNMFDLITCTEVIEHILPKHMELFLSELRRIMKVGGRILITTPNNENFKQNEVCCPECNTVFHRHGHCNRYTKASLKELMEKAGYNTIMCDTTDFSRFQKHETKTKIIDLSIRKVYDILCDKIKKYKNRKNTGTLNDIYFTENINIENAPNLFYVGTKI